MTPQQLERYERVKWLHQGSHHPSDGRLSITEAAAYVAGEPHTLWPNTLGPTIAAFTDRAADIARDRERQLLIALIPSMLNSAAPATEDRAALSVCLRALTVWTPVILRANNWPEQAERMAQSQSIPEAHDRAAHLLRHIQEMPSRKGHNRITETDHVLTMAAVAAQTIISLTHPLGIPRAAESHTGSARARRTAASIAADIMAVACKTADRAPTAAAQHPNMNIADQTINTVTTLLPSQNGA